jgi:hypothetical protein
MLRLTMVDDPTSTASDTDETTRAAAIAAMGYRLAAAGPRTRQRLLDRQADDDMPEESFSISPAMLRRLAVIGAAGACSFGLVLAAQGRNWNFLPNAGPEATIIARADQPRASAPPIVLSLTAPPALTVAATAEDHPQQLAAAEPPAAPKTPVVPKTPVHSAIPAKPAHVFADVSHPHPRQVAARIDPVAPRAADAKPHVLPRPAAVAHYELPHWLTDYHPEPKHALVMSEPPHDLVAPANAEHHAAAPEPAAAPQPVRMQYASAIPAPRPRPALRPPYGYGYGGPYAYGGPVYYPYAPPPPPPYYYQRW